MKANQGFPIAIHYKITHGILTEAIKQRGWSYGESAEFLGISQEKFRAIINMRKVPERISVAFAAKLEELTGMSPEELWPETVFTPEFLESPRDVDQIRKVPVHLLRMYAIIKKLPSPTPFDYFRRGELVDAVREAFASLSPRQGQIMAMLFLEGRTLDEVGKAFNVKGERIRQIRDDGIKKLRRPIPKNRRLRMLAMEML